MSASDIMRRKEIIDRAGSSAGGHWADPRERAHCRRHRRRIKGQYCPFCGGEIPHDFVICLNCGKDV